MICEICERIFGECVCIPSAGVAIVSFTMDQPKCDLTQAEFAAGFRELGQIYRARGNHHQAARYERIAAAFEK